MNVIIPELDLYELRKFAITTAGLLAIIFGAVLPWLFGAAWPWWPWLIAAVLALWGLLHSASLRPVYRVWMRVALLLGKVNSVLLLGIIFMLVISPAGVIMRLFGYDPLKRGFDMKTESYRKPGAARSQNHMEKPY
jgi:Kef-type K+ transport system membrane component KefB